MRKRTRVLVIDDEEVVRLGLARVLSETHHEVEMAKSGPDALSEMEKRDFDVVLLDLRLPGMDGMDVLKTIKQRWPDSEVVIVTGYPTIESAKEAIRLGANDYLAKPTDPEDVIRVTGEAANHRYWTLQREPAYQTESRRTAGANAARAH